MLGKHRIKGVGEDPNRKIISIRKIYVKLYFSSTKVVSRIYTIS